MVCGRKANRPSGGTVNRAVENRQRPVENWPAAVESAVENPVESWVDSVERWGGALRFPQKRRKFPQHFPQGFPQPFPAQSLCLRGVGWFFHNFHSPYYYGCFHEKEIDSLLLSHGAGVENGAACCRGETASAKLVKFWDCSPKLSLVPVCSP